MTERTTAERPKDAVGTVVPMGTRTWTSADVLLYALGVGAGTDELAFTTENTAGVDLQVLPTMAVVLERAHDGLDLALDDYDPAMAVHGEQEVILHKPIAPEGSLESVTTITGIYDKGSGTVIATETVSTDLADGQPLFTTRSSMFIIGTGGWGGDRGPAASGPGRPDRSPDLELRQRTGHDQALLYRLSGDRNPLHSDPAVAAAGGYPRPILHGLCTYGFVGRALLGSLCDGDPARFVRLRCRFSAPVYPGDELVTSVWRLQDDLALFETTRDGGEVVVRGGELEHR
jgi:acyl dehydratase